MLLKSTFVSRSRDWPPPPPRLGPARKCAGEEGEAKDGYQGGVCVGGGGGRSRGRNSSHHEDDANDDVAPEGRAPGSQDSLEIGFFFHGTNASEGNTPHD